MRRQQDALWVHIRTTQQVGACSLWQVLARRGRSEDAVTPLSGFRCESQRVNNNPLFPGYSGVVLFTAQYGCKHICFLEPLKVINEFSA